jgi:Big-like domain-containing protein
MRVKSPFVLVFVCAGVALPAQCRTDTTTPSSPPAVARVIVTPESVTVLVGATVRVTATPEDASGQALSGRPVTWASNDPQAATVDQNGLVTGIGPGTATVMASVEGKRDSAAITIAALPPPATVSCLDRAGPTRVLSGIQSVAYDDQSVADDTKLDASTAQFLTLANIPIHIGGGTNLCYHGGESIGYLPPATTWRDALAQYAVVADGPNVTVENVRTFDRGDGISFGTNVPNWTVRSVYVHYARDGCIENHFVFSGTVDDALLDGCYMAFASRPYTTSQDGSNNLMTIQHTLVRLQPMDGTYTGPSPGNGGFYEWSAISPRLSLHDDVFRADQNTNDGDEHMAPPPGKLADCSNNVMIWLGQGPFPEQLPSCFRVLTGAAGLQYWNTAVAQWKANHPALLADVGPPIVSLFAPAAGATLTGTVTLTATAADDREVTGVQFQLDGRAIGSEVTTDSPITKYTLQWDSRAAANGSHVLTASVRDAAGHTTTSVGIGVTISN